MDRSRNSSVKKTSGSERPKNKTMYHPKYNPHWWTEGNQLLYPLYSTLCRVVLEIFTSTPCSTRERVLTGSITDETIDPVRTLYPGFDSYFFVSGVNLTLSTLRNHSSLNNEIRRLLKTQTNNGVVFDRRYGSLTDCQGLVTASTSWHQSDFGWLNWVNERLTDIWIQIKTEKSKR